ncbi:MAG: DegT/DnrJ/EryC1/StrS family aminotransferase [Chloroflexi bacterium]|nr:DegT/DnrJ/EryC1/StrS family aminotransferase [Chloroflexota bacterium]OJW03405.1 MAG: aminotransferase DegT [Chloroflexi bacterium 54-19]
MTLLDSRTHIPIARPFIGQEEQEAVLRVMASGQLAQGREVAAFEEEFARACGVAYAIAVANGTTALHLALLANGVGPGDEVITTSFSFIATGNAILFTGARPVFVDIEEASFNLDPELVEEAITSRTKAIMPVHLFGQPARMDRLMEISQKFNLPIIEDACQAHLAVAEGKGVGSFGTGCFSFYPTKNMTSGEGGMVTTDDPAVADKVRILRGHGMRQRYYHETLGFNYRMTDLHAAIGRVQLSRLSGWNEQRQANAAFLDRKLAELGAGVVSPPVTPGYSHVYHQYTIRVRPGGAVDRDGLKQALEGRGIGSGVYYPLPIHRQAVYQDRGYNDSLPVTERACAEVLSLPVYPGLGSQELEYIAEAVAEVTRG